MITDIRGLCEFPDIGALCRKSCRLCPEDTTESPTPPPTSGAEPEDEPTDPPTASPTIEEGTTSRCLKEGKTGCRMCTDYYYLYEGKCHFECPGGTQPMTKRSAKKQQKRAQHKFKPQKKGMYCEDVESDDATTAAPASDEPEFVFVDGVVVVEDEASWSSKYGAENVLVDTGDDQKSSKAFWLAKKGRNDVAFTLELPRKTPVQHFVLKNTHNGDTGGFGTKAYQIQVSNNNEDFSDVASGFLLDVGGKGDDIPSEHVVLTSPKAARYVRFLATDFYGKGAGLNFFGIVQNDE
jgi:hypothetical protein